MVPARLGVYASVAAALMVLANAGGTSAAASPSLQYKIGTAGSGGIFVIFGAAIADVAQKAVPGLTVTVVASQGSAENAIRTSRGEFQFAMAGNDAAYQAFHGEKGFPGKMADLRVVLSGHKGHGHMMLPADSPIRSWGELKGKRIALTSPTSPSNVWAAAVLAHYGLQPSDYSPAWINSGQYTDAMKNGSIDAGSLLVGYPAPSPQELCTARVGLRLLSVPADAVKAVTGALPFLSPVTIPAGAYPCVKEDITTVANTVLLIAHKDVPDDVVYGVVKRILEKQELADVHVSGKEWRPETALDGRAGLPLHPGAERYFREKGLLK